MSGSGRRSRSFQVGGSRCSSGFHSSSMGWFRTWCSSARFSTRWRSSAGSSCRRGSMGRRQVPLAVVARDRRRAVDRVRRPAQRDGTAVVQGMADAVPAGAARALHLRALRKPRADAGVLAVAPARGCRVVGGEPGSAARPVGGIRQWLAPGPRRDVADQPLRPVRPAPGVAVPARTAVHEGHVHDAGSVPRRAPSAVFRVSSSASG